MNNDNILQRAIDTAIKNGYKDQYISVCDRYDDGCYTYQVGFLAEGTDNIFYKVPIR